MLMCRQCGKVMGQEEDPVIWEGLCKSCIEANQEKINKLRNSIMPY